MAGDINVVAIVKGEERYVFLFDDETRAETLRMLGRYASDSELSFSWYDAAVLSQKIRQTRPVPTPVDNGQANRIDSMDFFAGASGSAEDFPLFDDLPPIDDLWIGDEPIA